MYIRWSCSKTRADNDEQEEEEEEEEEEELGG
jgi:hypothetical protein